MNKFGFLSVAAAAAVGSFAMNTQAANVQVGLELSLLVDVSGSVDTTEYNLQRTGYINAFKNPAVQAAILQSQRGSIAVNFIEWSSSNQQRQTVGWTLINSVATAEAFANAIAATTRQFSGLTAPGNALNFATPLIFNNAFDSDRQVIDVSGDGAQNDGVNTATARNNALAAGVDAINGLVINPAGEAGLLAFYNNSIKGGATGFVEVADSFSDFGDAIVRKLVREITGTTPGVPVPASMISGLVLMTGLVGRRSRRA